MHFDLEKFMSGILFIGGKLIYCIVILCISAIAVKICKNLIVKMFSHRLGNKLLTERKTNTITSVVSSVAKYVIYFIAIFSILVQFGVSVASLAAVAGSCAVAIGLGAQSLIQDIISGFFILLEDQFSVGDVITVNDCTGVVEDVSIRTTRLRSVDGTVYIVPNGSIRIVTNTCKEFMNAIVDVGVGYEHDMEFVLRVLNDEMRKAGAELSGLKSIPVVLGIIGLDDSAVTIRIVTECEIKENFRIERELRLRIKNRLDSENISIPFPQRMVHIVNN